ncbi:MAG: MarC family protein [Methylobacteriaceae bacterium]|jgi:multiple antibiotic resistance protein|nr:MarC family protein [Methylobacteriaceae bacterium]
MNEFFLSSLVTVLATLDPPGLIPVFLAVTCGMTARQSREVCLRACLIAFFILLFFSLGGSWVLHLLGISLAAFRIGGGILLFFVAYNMVFEKNVAQNIDTAKNAVTREHIQNVSVFPLAIPMMSGPGTITAITLLSGQSLDVAHAYPVIELKLYLTLVIFFGILSCYVVCRLAKPISGVIGAPGNIILSRLLGLILAAMAAQFVVDGIREAFMT